MTDLELALSTIVKCLPDAPFKARVHEVHATALTRITKLEELLAEAYADADEVLRPYVADLEQQLAASQAREKLLRDRLVYVDAYLEAEGGFEPLRGDIALELSLPTDDTALRVALDEARIEGKQTACEHILQELVQSQTREKVSRDGKAPGGL